MTNLNSRFGRRLSFLAGISAISLGFSPSIVLATHFDLSTANIADINAAIDAGALSSEKLIQLYLNRIEAYDKKGPTLNSVLYLNPKALEEAKALDAERKAKGRRSPLHGLPVEVKDVLDTQDMPTTGGYLPLKGVKPTKDAFVIKRLREAGAIILAKMNQSDWYSQTGVSGLSSLGGQNRNPYDLTRIPGVSSAGTAAAMAAYFGTVGLGSETGFSVRTPSSDSNLYGLSATSGLISRDGQMWSYITGERCGPMARSVYDLAVTLDVIAGFDDYDLWTARSLGKMPENKYVSFIKKDGLKGARVGVLTDGYNFKPAIPDGYALAEKSIKVFEDNGARIIYGLSLGLDLPTSIKKNNPWEFEKIAAINHYLSRQGPDYPYHNASELLLNHPEITIAQTSLDALKNPVDLDRDPQYRAFLEFKAAMQQSVTDLMDKYHLEALIYPHRLAPAVKIGKSGSPGTQYEANQLSPIIGFPAFIVPSGFTSENVPIGFEILGRPWSEPTLIKLASGFEAVTHNRRTPPTTPPLPGESFDY